eukprot:2529359-Prymnesium_polylepis.1
MFFGASEFAYCLAAPVAVNITETADGYVPAILGVQPCMKLRPSTLGRQSGLARPTHSRPRAVVGIQDCLDSPAGVFKGYCAIVASSDGRYGQCAEALGPSGGGGGAHVARRRSSARGLQPSGRASPSHGGPRLCAERAWRW